MRPAIMLLAGGAIALAGCAQPHYHNATHPEYGATELNKDQGECQAQNTHAVTHIGNYGEYTYNAVDEDKSQACMATRGWQPAQN